MRIRVTTIKNIAFNTLHFSVGDFLTNGEELFLVAYDDDTGSLMIVEVDGGRVVHEEDLSQIIAYQRLGQVRIEY